MNKQDVSSEGPMTVPRGRGIMSTQLSRLSELARKDRALQFSSIAQFLTVEAIEQAFRRLRNDAGAGVDGMT